MKFIRVVAYECDGMLAFRHERVEAGSMSDAYDQEFEMPEGFRNWLIIPVATPVTYTIVECSRPACHKTFKIEDKAEGVITCPYCGHYVEG